MSSTSSSMPDTSSSGTASSDTEMSAPKRVKMTVKTEQTSPDSSPGKPKSASKKESKYDNVVFVLVGKYHDKFGIHQKVLTAASSIFKAILENHQAHEDVVFEATKNQFFLPGEEPALFTRVNTFLYSDNITLEDEKLDDLDWTTIISVYLFSTKWKMPRLQNKIIDITIQKQTAYPLLPGAENINRLFKNHTDAANFRELFLHLFCYKCDFAAAFAKGGPKYHERFMQGLVSTFYRMKEKGTFKEPDFWARRERYYTRSVDNPVVVVDD